jgi:hypothetical protein
MTTSHFYPVGTPGQPWGDTERAAWRSRQVVQRHYSADVVAALNALPGALDVVQYGQLESITDTYPLLLAMSRDWDPALPTALITGGVHGYETSGVHGALQFLREHAHDYTGRMNLIVAPCVCPWGYERIQRWNRDAFDPNRSFRDGGLIVESASLMNWIAARDDQLLVHLDLHETTDSDANEFDPALASRDGKAWVPEAIPDGFYVIGNSENPEPAFQKALIDAVAPITHIAPGRCARQPGRPAPAVAGRGVGRIAFDRRLRRLHPRALCHHHRGVPRQPAHHCGAVQRGPGGGGMRGAGFRVGQRLSHVNGRCAAAGTRAAASGGRNRTFCRITDSRVARLGMCGKY